jgi:hypothetical protein
MPPALVMRPGCIATLAMTVVALLVVVGGKPSSARAASPDDVYETIKRAERRIGAPEPRDRGVIGAYDASTNAFDGPRSRTTPPTCKGCDPVVFHPTLRINGVQAILVFRFRNVDSFLDVTVNSRRRRVRAGATRLAVNVRRARRADWKIEEGSTVVSDEVRITRPHLLGAGAFTMEAVPLALIYAPPQPAAPDRVNRQSFAEETFFATSVKSSFSQSKSRTKPSKTGYEKTALLQGAVRLGAKALAAQEDPKLKAAGAALGVIATAMGKVEVTKQEVQTGAHEREADYIFRKGVVCQAATRADPGAGDLIAFATNVRLVWFDNGRRTRLAVLGAQGFACPSVALLRRGLAVLERARTKPALCVAPLAGGTGPSPSAPVRRCGQGLSADTVRGLLALDPFAVAGPSATLSDRRFRPADPARLGPLDPGGDLGLDYSATVKRSDLRSQVKTRVATRDASSGFLGYIGFGPRSTQTVVSTLTLSSSSAVTTGRTISATLDVQGPPPGTDTLDVFYDRIFGTFALQPGPRFLPNGP